MTITLTVKDYDELWEESQEHSTRNPTLEAFEYFCETPKKLGKGYYRKADKDALQSSQRSPPPAR
ncbi:hypothetical protein NIES2101_32170 [Calothrix sp. HK-06]|nr:hypothetical protein NIES2101_32170 [Calothrix sp. HK-06]